jgi:hypothetical protein
LYVEQVRKLSTSARKGANKNAARSAAYLFFVAALVVVVSLVLMLGR